MLAFAYYLLKVIICSAVLFGYYWFFLRNKIYHVYNRYYLLATVLISLAFPLFSIQIFHETAAKTTVIKMLQVVNAGDEYVDDIIINAPVKTSYGTNEITLLVYCLVSLVFFLFLVQMLVSIFKLIQQNEKVKIENVHFINTDAAKGTPFSFFQYIFWNKQIDVESETGNRIFKHELAHIQERHSWDKIFINLVLIVFWINPIFWLVRKELNMIHEFIADKKAVGDGDTAAFAAMILEATYPQRTLFLTNSFFYSPIKRRFMMLTKIKNNRTGYISRLLVLPLLVFVFAAFTLKAKEVGADKKIKRSVESIMDKLTGARSNDSKNAFEPNNIQLDRMITVIIDAGHGGKDDGARSIDGIKEKDIALQLALAIQTLNTNPNIKLILSREVDIFNSPREKSEFAKANNADLFISVHCESTPWKENSMVTGLGIYIARNGNENVEGSKLLASSIIQSFNGNYGLPVQPNPQQRQKGIWVLTANNFPSVLIEAGNLRNKNEVSYLQSKKGQETFAKNVLDAINNYATSFSIEKLSNQKNLVDSPQSNNFLITSVSPIKISQAKSNDEGFLISGEINVSDFRVDFNLKNSEASKTGVIIINGRQYNPSELNNKTITGGEAFFYKEGNHSLIKEFGADALNGVIILNDAIVTNTKIINGDNPKDNVRIKMDSIMLVDASERKLKTNENIVQVLQASNEDVKLFKKLGHVYTRAENDGELPYKGPNRLVLRDDVIQYSMHVKLFKGDLIVLLTSKEAVEKYGDKAFNGALEITSKSNYAESSTVKIPFINNQDTNRIVFIKLENEAEFPGGNDAWRKFLQTNLNGSMAVAQGLKAGTYTFITKFIVDKEGNLSSFSSEKNINTKIADHCIEVLKKSPKWIPGKQNGHIVASYKKLPITFVVAEE